MIRNVPSDILDFMEENPHATGAQISEKFSIPSRTARHYREAVAAGEARPRSAALADWQKKVADHTFVARDVIEEMRRSAEEKHLADPVFATDTWTFSGDRPVAIMFASCMHIGGRYTAYGEFAQVYDTLVNDPDIHIASLGDDVEGFLDSFPDKDAVWQQVKTPAEQRAILEQLLVPLKDRILCGCGSQHGSQWILKRQAYDPVKELYLETLDAPFYDGMAYVRVCVGDQTYHIALSHEFKGSSSLNPLHAQARALKENFPSADIVVMGDRHTPAMQYSPVYTWEYDMGLRDSPFALLLQAGTTKTGLDKFTLRGWSRGVFGWPFVVLYPDEHRYKFTFDYEDVKQWLR